MARSAAMPLQAEEPVSAELLLHVAVLIPTMPTLAAVQRAEHIVRVQLHQREQHLPAVVLTAILVRV